MTIKCFFNGHQYKMITQLDKDVDYARYVFWCPCCGKLKQQMQPIFQSPTRNVKG